MAIQYGMSEQTAAARNTINKILGRKTVRRVKRAAKKVRRAARKVRKVARAARRVTRAVKLRKGSAAAKAHMARLRKMRRK